MWRCGDAMGAAAIAMRVLNWLMWRALREVAAKAEQRRGLKGEHHPRAQASSHGGANDAAQRATSSHSRRTGDVPSTSRNVPTVRDLARVCAHLRCKGKTGDLGFESSCPSLYLPIPSGFTR